MSPASVRAGCQGQHPLVLVVGAARGAEAGQQPPFDRRHVGRLEADRGPEVVVGLRIVGTERTTARSASSIALATSRRNSAAISGGGSLRATVELENEPR